MSNITKLYNEAISGTIENKVTDEQKQAELAAQQKNLEAWAQWRELDQTKRFIAVLQDVRNKLSIGVAANATHVPDVLDTWIRARLAEVSLLDEIMGRTCMNGELRDEMFKVKKG